MKARPLNNGLIWSIGLCNILFLLYPNLQIVKNSKVSRRKRRVDFAEVMQRSP